MTKCPACRGSGRIMVRSIDAGVETHVDGERPCPMGCEAPPSFKVRVGRVKPKPLGKSRYSEPLETLDWRKYYIGDKD